MLPARVSPAPEVPDDRGLQEGPVVSVRSHLLALRTNLSGTAEQLAYTVPAGRTAILKQLALMNRTGASATLVISIRRGVTVMQIVRETVANNTVFRLGQLFWVLHPGDQIVLDSSVGTGTYEFAAAGSLLEGAPT